MSGPGWNIEGWAMPIPEENPDNLDSEEIDALVDRIADRFERDWRSGARPSIQSYLEEAQGESRTALLIELVKLDLEYCRKSGLVKDLPDYVSVIPDLQSADPSVLRALADYLKDLDRLLAEEDEPSGQRRLSDTRHDSLGDLNDALDQTSQTTAKYLLHKELARGGMGVVMLCTDKTIGRPVAMKVMRPEVGVSGNQRIRFLQEAQVTGQLEHPNIVPLHELGRNTEGDIYFTMKLVRGRSLGEILKDLKQVSGVPPAAGQVSGEDRQPSSSGLKPERSPLTTPTGKAHHSPPTLTDLLTIFLKVCDGVAFAHSRGVIHRDLKPDNIMVGDFGEVVISDWGLAKVLRRDRGTMGPRDNRTEEPQEREGADVQPAGGKSGTPSQDGTKTLRSKDLEPESSAGNRESTTVLDTGGTGARTVTLPPSAGPGSVPTPAPPQLHPPLADSHIASSNVRTLMSDSDTSLTQEGAVAGTPAYMSPEQAEGRSDLVDELSDIYSLGAILYEILTLERPVQGASLTEMVNNARAAEVVPPAQRSPGRNIPDELAAVAMKAMSRTRAARYPSVTDLACDINLFLEGRSVSAKEDTSLQAFAKLVRRNKGVSAAIAAAVLVLAVMGALFTYDNARKRRQAEDALQAAVDAQKAERQTKLAASERFAMQAVQAAEEGRLAEAEARADGAAETMPDGPWGYYARAIIAREKGDWDRVGEMLGKALSQDPAHQPALAAKASLLTLLGKTQEALEQVKRLDQVTDWRSLSGVAQTLMAAGRFTDAQRAYERVLELMAKDSFAPREAVTDVKDRWSLARAEAGCQGLWERVRDLPAGEMAKRIEAKLGEIHDKPVVMGRQERDGALDSVNLNSFGIKYLQPLRGLPLRELSLTVNPLSDLTPLKGMPLRSLDVSQTSVTDLEPLRGMPLVSLGIGHTKVSDLDPLRNAPLEQFNAVGAPIKDLGPLKGAPLRSLALQYTMVTDLNPLRGAPLTSLTLTLTKVADLRPLERMPLESLYLDSTKVSDLTPLKGMPLKALHLHNARVIDLAPLQGMPLQRLSLRATTIADISPLSGAPMIWLDISYTKVTDLRPLRGMPLQFLDATSNPGLRSLSGLEGLPLETLHLRAASVEDISHLKGLPLKDLDISQTVVADLDPLKGAPLTKLSLEASKVVDIGPLAGMPLSHLNLRATLVRDLKPLTGRTLTVLNLEATPVSDLTPLSGMLLTTLFINGTHVTDLTALRGMPLQQFYFDPGKIEKGIQDIRQIRTLQRIGTDYCHAWKPEEFWPKYDAGEFRNPGT
jgi:serine/threonine protein kinase/Leucine-rich repeat (LRR) protein/tetratricopeptide (TPR) repeat protein